MGKQTITGNHTANREAWLRHLAEHGPDSREGRGVTPYQCMQLGWTDWVDPPPAQFPWHEKLTDEGRRVLASWGYTPERAGRE